MLARADIRRATVIEWQCHEMSEVSRWLGREGIFPYPIFDEKTKNENDNFMKKYEINER